MIFLLFIKHEYQTNVNDKYVKSDGLPFIGVEQNSLVG